MKNKKTKEELRKERFARLGIIEEASFGTLEKQKGASLLTELQEIIYEGVFCDVNECASQYIDISPMLESSTGGTRPKPIKVDRPCTCNGEFKRQSMIKSIEQLLVKKLEEEKKEFIEDLQKIELANTDDLIDLAIKATISKYKQ